MKSPGCIIISTVMDILSRHSRTEIALATAFCTSAMILVAAHLFERVGGLIPCVLCLDQREAHWTALAVAAAGLALARGFKSRLGAAAAVGAVALVYAVSTGLSFYHTGVEYHFWPGPAICGAGGAAGPLNIDAITAALEGPTDAPACDEVPWSLFGVSMAGYNMLISAGLFALTAFVAAAETRRAREDQRQYLSS